MNVQISVALAETVQGVRMPKQAHTSIVREVSRVEVMKEACDALLTTNRDIVIGVHTRDCAPICFGDGTKVAVAHVGWRGLCGGIIENVLAHFESEPTEVFVGPFLHTFEIQKDECHEAIVGRFGERFLTESQGKLMFNFKDAIALLLPHTTAWDGRNTETDATLPSHRHKRALGHIITSVQL